MDNDLLKKIESLEKRVAELESQKKDNLQMFGRSYFQVGNSSSDFLIKTKGQVKIQWGSKFIDLIKEGKINVESSFIYTVKTYSDIGVKDGIYVIEDGSIYILLNSKLYSIAGEIGNTYVSFLENQESTAENKYNALTNIGFIYKDLLSVTDSSLLNGIIYIEEDLKLYIIKNGILFEYKMSIPSPYTELFIIAKSGNDYGAIVIKGTGYSNSLAFDTAYFYSDGGSTYIESDGNIEFVVNNSQIIQVTNNQLRCSGTIFSNDIESYGSNINNGYRLYLLNGKSYLEIDNLTIRESLNGINFDNNEYDKFTSFWLCGKNNIIKSIEFEDSYDPDEDGNINYYCYNVALKYNYTKGDESTIDNDVNSDIIKPGYRFYTIINSDYITMELPMEVESINNDIIKMKVDLTQVVTNGDVNNILDDILNLVGKPLFYEKAYLKISNDGYDIIEYNENNSEVIARLGKISKLNLYIRNNESGQTLPVEDDGFYSKNLYFNNAAYIITGSEDDEREIKYLSLDDCSSRIASTEWVANWTPINGDTTSLSEFISTFKNNIDTLQSNFDGLEDNLDEKYLTEYDLSDYIKKSEINSYISSNVYVDASTFEDYQRYVYDTYATNTYVSNTYLTISNASNTYLTKSDASTIYLSKNNAGSIYLTINDAAGTYLDKNSIANTYLAQSDFNTFKNSISEISNDISVSYTGEYKSDELTGTVSDELKGFLSIFISTILEVHINKTNKTILTYNGILSFEYNDENIIVRSISFTVPLKVFKCTLEMDADFNDFTIIDVES